MSHKPPQYELALEIAHKIQTGEALRVEGKEYLIRNFEIRADYASAGGDQVQRAIEYTLMLVRTENAPYLNIIVDAFLSSRGEVVVSRYEFDRGVDSWHQQHLA